MSGRTAAARRHHDEKPSPAALMRRAPDPQNARQDTVLQPLRGVHASWHHQCNIPGQIRGAPERGFPARDGTRRIRKQGRNCSAGNEVQAMFGTTIAMLIAAATPLPAEQTPNADACYECPVGEPSDPMLETLAACLSACLQESLESDGALAGTNAAPAADGQLVSLTTDLVLAVPQGNPPPSTGSVAGGSSAETPWDEWEQQAYDDWDSREGPR
ncbi:MAG: hypothetical protein HKN12_03850 [Gemmatimonadetes bacterium]|nr:hypothetical protein [Gemmatimonadota bacterium]